MGILTMVVCATVAAAPATQGGSKRGSDDGFDFDGPRARATLSSPQATVIREGKSTATKGELTVEAQDRVDKPAFTFGDSGQLVSRFTVGKKDVEVRSKAIGFRPGKGGDAKAIRGRDRIEGGVDVKPSGKDDSPPKQLKLWGTAELKVNGKTVTDRALIAVSATKQGATLSLLRVPKSLAPDAKLTVRFKDVVLNGEREGDTTTAPVARGQPSNAAAGQDAYISWAPEEQPAQGVGGSGNSGQGTANQANGGGQRGGAQYGGNGAAGSADTGTDATQGGAGGSALNMQGQGTPTPLTSAGGAQAGSPFPGTQPAYGPPAQAPFTAQGPGAALQAAQQSTTRPPSGLEPIDYTGASNGLAPIFPSAAATSGAPAAGGAPAYGAAGPGFGFAGQTFGSQDLGFIDYSQPVGSTGVPAANAAAPGSTSDLGRANGAEVTPGIPASPSVLNNGRFPRALQNMSGATPGLPASPAVLNDGRFPLGPTGVAPSPAGQPTGTTAAPPTGAATPGANTVGAGGQ